MGQKVSKWIGAVVTEATPDPNKILHNWKHTPYIDIDKDMQLLVKPVYQCQFKSSHNSVVADVQIFGEASINCLAFVLNNGVRAIELDMFESQKRKGVPVVSHGNKEFNLQVTSAVDLKVCLQYIRDFAWVDTNEPLFIFMEMNVEDETTLMNMENLFLEYLGHRIFTPGSAAINAIQLSRLKNKCVVIPSTKQPLLSKVCQGMSLYGGKFRNIGSNDDPEEPVGEMLIRVYADNLFLSRNPNPLPFLQKRNQFVCLNWTYEDNWLKTYKKYFGNKGVL